MRDGLKIGLTHSHSFTITAGKTVPALYPEAESFQEMPAVLATGYLVGLLEWACIETIRPFMEEGEGSLGTHVDFSHEAATPPSLTVTVKTRVENIEGKRIWFVVEAHDGMDLISRGRHERAVVRWDRFNDKVQQKLDQKPV